ncbi:MAG: DUF4978 domain-containing protein [Polyangiaceae bacterium]
MGDDTYDDGENPTWMTQAVPPIGKNYQMMMEVGADVAIVPQLCLAALSANVAFSYYDMCGPDGHGLYVETGVNTFKPRGSYVDTVRTLNRLLTSDVVDIARLKAQSSSGLFVHNWMGTSSSATTGVRGVSFTPSSSASQGISIARSSTENRAHEYAGWHIQLSRVASGERGEPRIFRRQQHLGCPRRCDLFRDLHHASRRHDSAPHRCRDKPVKGSCCRCSPVGPAHR